jgi:hypothetical protein
LISKELHKKLKEYSAKTGIKIKHLTEASIKSYLAKMKFKEDIEKLEEKKHER